MAGEPKKLSRKHAKPKQFGGSSFDHRYHQMGYRNINNYYIMCPTYTSLLMIDFKFLLHNLCQSYKNKCMHISHPTKHKTILISRSQSHIPYP